MVGQCEACAERAPSQTPEPIIQEPLPSRAFESVSTDLFHLAGYEWLVMSDRYSGWPFVGKCGRSANSAEVIRQLKDWMTLTGIPAKLSSDVGPQFSSRAFRVL